MTEQRYCLCGVDGCREPIGTGGNGRQKYARGHKQRAYRKRVEDAMTANGLPAHPSMKAVQMAQRTGERNGAPETPRKATQAGRKRPSGRQIAYGKAVAMLIEDGHTPEAAAAKLDRLLPERQRTARNG